MAYVRCCSRHTFNNGLGLSSGADLVTKVGICSECKEGKWLNLAGLCEICDEEIKMMIRDDGDADSKR